MVMANNIQPVNNTTGPNATEHGHWLGAVGYYEGDRQPNSVAVPQRPSAQHQWTGSEWVEVERDAALYAISLLEKEQLARVTPRAQRELYMGIFNALGMTQHPAYAALKVLDDAIKLERAKL
jgi:hypothetical protein